MQRAPVEGCAGICLATRSDVTVTDDIGAAQRRVRTAQRAHQRGELLYCGRMYGRSSVPSSSIPTEKSLHALRPQ